MYDQFGNVIANVERNVGDAIAQRAEQQLADKIRPYVVGGAVGLGLFAVFLVYKAAKAPR